MIKFREKTISLDNFSHVMSEMIYQYIKEHNVAKKAHEEIMAMVHTDKDIAKYYYNREICLTNELCEILINSGFKRKNLREKIHIMIGMIDNLCHEVIYHKHDNMDYKMMCKIVIDNIEYMIKKEK